MRKGTVAALVWAALVLVTVHPQRCEAVGPVKHELRVRLDPEGHGLSARDVVTVPTDLPATSGKALRFLLHEGLSPHLVTEGVTLRREPASCLPADFLPGVAGRPSEVPDSVPSECYTIILPEGVRSFSLEYRGALHHPITEGGREYALGFGVTPGIISAEGAYLSGSSLWYPWLGDGLVTFSLEIQAPPDWQAVSQGARTKTANDAEISLVRWESPEPQREIYLLAGPLILYHRGSGDVQTLAYLRTADPEIATRYLEATARYLDLYSSLLGAYPYPKFALVENFWETGYGMPSFTLLGPKVLRFPFLINTSYPHEILHNWWGNGVYVDERGGNWSEGLTSYLADHLLAERRGEGVEHRRSSLQKYADYAVRSRDFPLSEFLSRNSAATEAVGYGKALFFFHMLRRQLGDESFRKALREFYGSNRFRVSSYADLRRAFEGSAGRDLGVEFSQWVERAGAPSLVLRDVKAAAEADGFTLTGALEQVQAGEPYRLGVPVAVTLEGKEGAYQTVVAMAAPRTEFSLRFAARPLRIDVDPEFDVFRRLAEAEVPPALSGIFGAEKVSVVLPLAAPEPLRAAYREVAESWSAANPGKVELMTDDKLSELPAGRAVWVFGWENRFLPAVQDAISGYEAKVAKGAARFGKEELAREGRAAVAVARRAGDAPIAWLASDDAGALPGLARKLPHYHKWSYLVFEGSEPVNVLKGFWPVVGSPLTVELGPVGVRAERGKLAPRVALAEAPRPEGKEGTGVKAR